MRLVIERDGGFTVIESDDVQDVNVCSDGVDIVRRDGASVRLEREDHAASVALATAIALRCGVLVEALIEALIDSEDDKRERELLEGLGELAPRPLPSRR